MMKNDDQSVKINHSPNWPNVPGIYYRISMSGSGETNLLLNLIKNQQPHIDKNYLYVKDRFESKYQLLIKRRKKVGAELLKNLKAFVDY